MIRPSRYANPMNHSTETDLSGLREFPGRLHRVIQKLLLVEILRRCFHVPLQYVELEAKFHRGQHKKCQEL